jgi:hypothetical protein
MRFVSRHSNYTFIARPDAVQMVIGPGGVMIPQQVQAPIICDFTHGMVRPEECEMAKQHWLGFGRREDGAVNAYGATPTTVVGVVNGVAHDGWNPDLMFSVFDTESIGNEENRKHAEERLLNDASMGNHYIQVSGRKLDPPWPTYENMQGKKGKPTAALICDMIRDGGYDPDYVIAYELQRERPRYEIPKAIEALKIELAAEAVENASLQREIPA